MMRNYEKIDSAEVYRDRESGKLVVTASPREVWPLWHVRDDDNHPHNCDEMGCGQCHVIARTTIPADRTVPND